MIYAYKCRACGQRYESPRRLPALPICTTIFATTTWEGDDVPEPCTGVPTRDFTGISVGPRFVEHFNPTVGEPVTSSRDFARKLHVKGEKYTETTGIPVNYQPVDWGDTRNLGVTEEGLDSTNRHRVDVQGLPPIRVP